MKAINKVHVIHTLASIMYLTTEFSKLLSQGPIIMIIQGQHDHDWEQPMQIKSEWQKGS